MLQQSNKLPTQAPAVECRLNHWCMVHFGDGRPGAPVGGFCLAIKHQPTHEGPISLAIQIGRICLLRTQDRTARCWAWGVALFNRQCHDSAGAGPDLCAPSGHMLYPCCLCRAWKQNAGVRPPSCCCRPPPMLGSFYLLGLLQSSCRMLTGTFMCTHIVKLLELLAMGLPSC